MKTISTKTLLLLSLFAGTFTAVNVIAEEDLFAALDVNQDGAIDTEEASAHDVLSASFLTLDVNGDGVITRDEFATLEK